MTKPADNSWHVEHNFSVYDSKGKLIANAHTGNFSEAHSNANLISTAPEFLDLAEELIKDDGNISRELRKKLEDLINRAHGYIPDSPLPPEPTPVKAEPSPGDWEVAERFVDEGMALGIRSTLGTWLAYASNELEDDQALANMTTMAHAPKMIDALDRIQLGLTTVSPENINIASLAHLAEDTLEQARRTT